MKMKMILGVVVVIGALASGALLRYMLSPPSPPNEPMTSAAPNPGPAAVMESSTPSVEVTLPPEPAPILPPAIPQAATPAPAPVATPLPQPAAVPEPLTPEAIGRQALAMVGADPQANQIWVRTINDVSLPPQARRNLIEDLNEEGFPDPRNLTAADLTLIVSRLILVERLSLNPIDEVNAQALNEAHKDLTEMYQRAGGQ